MPEGRVDFGEIPAQDSHGLPEQRETGAGQLW